jgi:hypothetical protein
MSEIKDIGRYRLKLKTDYPYKISSNNYFDVNIY